MHRTHCKHCSLMPLLVSNNNLVLLRCGYVCAGMLVHIPRNLSRTSKNNKRWKLIIHCVFCNSRRMDLVYDDVRYMVYRWGFPYLDYSFDVLSHEAVNWDVPLVFPYLLSLGFTMDFLFYFYYYIYAYILVAFYSTGLLLLSYYIMHVLSWYHNCIFPYLLSLYLLLYVYTHDTIFNTCFFNSDLSIHICLSLWLVSKMAYFIPHLHIYLILNPVNNTSLSCF